MIRHYLILAWQQLEKYRLQSLVSIVGLGIGFACFALTMLWIRYERTFDTQHPEADRLYVVYEKQYLYVREPVAGYLAMNFPEVAEASNVSHRQMPLLIDGVEQKVYSIEGDSSFLNMTGLLLVAGNTDFWMHSDQVAVTEKFATRVWGTESPIGKSLNTPYGGGLTVTAVVNGYDKHSNFPFEILNGLGRNPSWSNLSGVALVRLHPNVDAKAFMTKIDSLVVKVPERHETWGVAKTYDYTNLRAVPLSEFRQVLSDSGLPESFSTSTELIQFRHIRLVGLAGALIILSALLNYLTMFLNRIFIRQREMVLRSVFGATKRDLMTMLFTEYVLLLVISLGVGLFLMEAMLPWFFDITGITSTRQSLYAEAGIYSGVVMLLGFLLSAPAINYFRRKAAQHTLQGRGAQHIYQNFRKVSVVVQLIIGLGFTFCTVVMMLQLEKLRHTDPGFQRENMAVLSIYNTDDRQAFAQHLNEMPEVREWHEGYSLFPKSSMLCFGMRHNGEGNSTLGYIILGAKEYQQFYNLRLKEGRWLEEGDEGVAVVTEATVKAMGLENPIGEWVGLDTDNGYTIIGVAEDIYPRGPTDKVQPYLFCSDVFGNNYDNNDYLIKYHPGTWSSLRQKVIDLMGDVEKTRSHSLINCEEEFDKIILSELTLRKLMLTISVVCILISLFGIWSMIMLNCEQRRKEIAVRKVYGATVGDILRQFAIEYGLLLVVSVAIAFPVGYVCMKPWVEQFNYQITFAWWIYASIFVGATLLVALCVGWRVWKTAKTHPADEIAKGRG